jgi:2-C-methyl-D-erythritol 4-phosphate cytidylyltransferase
MRVGVIIVAAGEGKRIGSKIPKPFIEIGGVPILTLTLRPFQLIETVEEIVVVVKKDWVAYTQKEVVKKFCITKVSKIIEGGEKRQDSVKNGLDVVKGDIIAIHDGARPFISPQFLSSIIEECKKSGAVIPALPVNETLKKVEKGFVKETIDRREIYRVQTPQVFRSNIIRSAYRQASHDGYYGTDDASLVERIGIRVRVIAGLYNNIKITTKEDLAYAEAIIKMQRSRYLEGIAPT